jgi:hypothetical protein
LLIDAGGNLKIYEISEVFGPSNWCGRKANELVEKYQLKRVGCVVEDVDDSDMEEVLDV